jgi:hypothetical protein
LGQSRARWRSSRAIGSAAGFLTNAIGGLASARPRR